MDQDDRSIEVFVFEDKDHLGDVGFVLHGAEIVEYNGELVPLVRMSPEEVVNLMTAFRDVIAEAIAKRID